MSEPAHGTLYLIPSPLGENWLDSILPPATQALAARLTHFVVEHPKTARAFLKQIDPGRPVQGLHLATLDEHTPAADLASLLEPLLSGQDVGLISEAGCPAVADPGAALVALAHTHGISVKPLVGPSSILLALMSSGLDGQRFAFHGYLPADRPGRIKALAELERDSRRQRRTQIWIETPYRNDALLADALVTCQPATRLCVALGLTLPGESVRTQSIADWRRAGATLGKRPAVFLLLA